MRAINRLPVDDDIIDRIYTFLPTFGTLKSVIFVSKAFYGVFSAHPTSIIRAVAYNVAGPALPQLMRFIRYSSSSGEPQETDDIVHISRQEMTAIEETAKVARGLEDIFSLRHKNRTSVMSTLNPDESWCFRRAIYRLLMYSAKWPGARYTEEDNDADLDQDKQDMQQFLEEFSTEELLEIHVVRGFLIEVSSWSCLARPGSETPIRNDDFNVSAGPAIIYRCYTLQSIEPFDDFFNYTDMDNLDPNLLSDYLAGPIGRLLEDRGATTPPDNSSQWKIILQEVTGEDDSCTQCGKECGLELWGESNWHYMAGTRQFLSTASLHGLLSMLKSQLKDNSNITLLVIDQSSELGNAFYPKLMTDIFNLRTPEFTTWQSADWLCDDCLAKIITAHLHLVLLKWKHADGQTIGEDCPDGWDCQMQIDNLSHALEVNHLCEPTVANIN